MRRMVEAMADDNNDEGEHAKPDPAAGDGQVPPGTPIDPKEPKGGDHQK